MIGAPKTYILSVEQNHEGRTKELTQNMEFAITTFYLSALKLPLKV